MDVLNPSIKEKLELIRENRKRKLKRLPPLRSNYDKYLVKEYWNARKQFKILNASLRSMSQFEFESLEIISDEDLFAVKPQFPFCVLETRAIV